MDPAISGIPSWRYSVSGPFRTFFGGEILTILAGPAFFHLLAARLDLGRRAALVGPWLFSAIFFGMAHLPADDWKLVQRSVIVGSARLVLTPPYNFTTRG